MLYATVFHTDTRLYTMLMVDLGMWFAAELILVRELMNVDRRS